MEEKEKITKKKIIPMVKFPRDKEYKKAKSGILYLFLDKDEKTILGKLSLLNTEIKEKIKMIDDNLIYEIDKKKPNFHLLTRNTYREIPIYIITKGITKQLDLKLKDRFWNLLELEEDNES